MLPPYHFRASIGLLWLVDVEMCLTARERESYQVDDIRQPET